MNSLITYRPFFYLTCLLFVGGCSWFSWLPWVDAPEEEDEEDEPAPLVRFQHEVNIDRLWNRQIGDGLGRKYLRLNPVVLADRIYAADGYGVITALDRFSGKEVWSTTVDALDGGFFSGIRFWDRKDPSFISGGMGAGGGLVLVGTTAGYVVALSAADGTEQWRADVDSEVLSAPAVGDGLVFAQTIDGRLVALGDEDGEQVWSFDNQVPVLTLRGTPTPVFASGVVYTGFASGKISAVRANNGEPIWEHRVMLPEGRSELDRMVDVDATPVLVGGVVYAAAFQGRVKALRQRDGQPLWERELSSYLDLAEGYGQIYVVDDEDVVSAIDRQSADIAWQNDALKRRKLSPPLAFSNYVVVGDEEGHLHVLAQSDGRMMGRRKVDGDGLRSRAISSDGTMYVLGNSGRLSAFEIRVK